MAARLADNDAKHTAAQHERTQETDKHREQLAALQQEVEQLAANLRLAQEAAEVCTTAILIDGN
jgi:hypothetical protein